MNDSEMASLVEALTPRVVEACRNRLMNNSQLSVTTGQFDSNRPSSSNTGRTSTCRPQSSHLEPPSSGRLSAIWPGPSTSGQQANNRPNMQRSTPREELRRSFQSGTKRTRKLFTPYRKKENGAKCMDVVLLPHHTWKKVVKGSKRAALHRDGLLIDKFRFEKSWTENQLFDALSRAFAGKLKATNGEPITFCIKKAEGSDLLQPRIRPDEHLDGAKICEIFGNKTVYLCPDRALPIPSETVISSDESDHGDENKDDLFELPSESDAGATISNGAKPETNEGFTCQKCTFINPASAVECEMCFESVIDEEETTMPELMRRVSKSECANPVKTIQKLVGFDKNPPQILYVSRDTLFEDNIAFFKNKFESNQPISIRFAGEKAIDAGGPLRENFRILMRKLHAAELNMFFGTHSHNLLPSNNQMLLYSGMFEVLGKIISAGIINGVPLKLPLHPAVIDCVLDRPRDEHYGKISTDDILDIDLKEFLTKILNCEEDDELISVVNDEANPIHWLDNCGWPVSKQMTVSCKHEIVTCVTYHYIIGIRSSAITAIQTGMKCNDKFPWKVITPSQLRQLLSPPSINATELKRLVQPSIDKLKTDASKHATYVTSLIDGITDADANVIAVFATAADCMYEDLTEIKLQLNTFNSLESSPIGNTCSGTILFPVCFSNCDEFKMQVLKRMKEALEFFGMM